MNECKHEYLGDACFWCGERKEPEYGYDTESESKGER